jgi:hypothetical protein
MAASPRNPGAIPAALRPKPRDPSEVRPPPAGPHPDPDFEIHLAIVVPDIRLYDLIRDRVIVTSPLSHNVRVHGHVVLEDARHPAAQLPLYTRQALVEAGLVDPHTVGFGAPEQITLGWPKQED